MNKTGFQAAILAVTMGAAIASSAQAQTQTRPAGQQPANRAAPAPTPAPAASPAAAPRHAAEEGGAIKNTEVVARVGDGDVTAEEIRAAIGQLDARQQAAVARDPALLSQTVRAILAGRLVLKEAIGKKWDQQPAVAAQLVRVRDNLIAETYLQSVTNPPDSFPSETEIKNVYEANASALLVPRRFKLAQIVVNLARDADKATEEGARKKLDDIVRKAKATGQDFGSLARSVSEDTATAERDGEIGWINEPDLRPEIRSQVVGLQKSGVTDPVRLDDGWHILKLLDTEAARTRALAEVRDALVQRMRTERAEANRRAYMAELLKQTPPVVNELALSKLLDTKPEPVPSR